MGKRVLVKNGSDLPQVTSVNEFDRIDDGVYGNNGLLLVYTQRRENPELSVYECGWEQGRPGYAFGPAVRGYYILHYITKGGGKYTVGGKTYSLSAHEFFLIPPELSTFYSADPADPWTYFWVGFNGLEAKRLLGASGFGTGVYTLKPTNPDKVEQIMRAISHCKTRTASAEYGMLGNLYLLFSLLMENAGDVARKKENETYVSKAIKFINENYAQNIGVTAVARYIGLQRSYFFKIFKAAIGISPQEYLINTRMHAALVLLRENKMRLSEVAAAVGYDNYINFCKMFRSKFGISPKEYARNPYETD